MQYKYRCNAWQLGLFVLLCSPLQWLMQSDVRWSAVQCSAVYCTVRQYSAVLCRTVQHSWVQCSAVPLSMSPMELVKHTLLLMPTGLPSTLHYPALHYTILHCTALHSSAIEGCSVQGNAMQCTMIDHNKVQYITPHSLHIINFLIWIYTIYIASILQKKSAHSMKMFFGYSVKSSKSSLRSYH